MAVGNNAMPPQPDEDRGHTVQALLAEYKHCADDIRNLDSNIFQIPAIGGGLLYAFAYIASSAALPVWAQACTWLTCLFLIGSLTFGLKKHRYFQKCKVDDLARIILLLQAQGCQMYQLPIRGPDVSARHPQAKGGSKVRAYKLLVGSMVVMCLLVLVLFIRTLRDVPH